MNRQPTTFHESSTQLCDALLVSTTAGGDVYDQHNKEERVLSSDDEEVGNLTCAASQ